MEKQEKLGIKKQSKAIGGEEGADAVLIERVAPIRLFDDNGEGQNKGQHENLGCVRDQDVLF